MSDLVGEALRSIPESDESTNSSDDESPEDGNSFPDPLWIQFFKSKCGEFR